MNSNELDQILKDTTKNQDKIQDDGFTAQVMARLPRKKKSKRGLILGTSVLLGSTGALTVFGSYETLFEIFRGPAVPLVITAMAMIFVMSGLFLAASEEI